MNDNRIYKLFIQPPTRSLASLKESSPEELVVKEVEFQSPLPAFSMLDLIYEEIHKYVRVFVEDPTILYIDDRAYKHLMGELADKNGKLHLLDTLIVQNIKLTICLISIGLGVAGPASRDFIVTQQNKLYSGDKK